VVRSTARCRRPSLHPRAGLGSAQPRAILPVSLSALRGSRRWRSCESIKACLRALRALSFVEAVMPLGEFAPFDGQRKPELEVIRCDSKFFPLEGLNGLCAQKVDREVRTRSM